VIVEPSLALELHTTLCALVYLFGVAMRLVVIIPALPDALPTQLTGDDCITACALGPDTLMGELFVFSQLVFANEGFSALVADEISFSHVVLLVVSQLGTSSKHFITLVTRKVLHVGVFYVRL